MVIRQFIRLSRDNVRVIAAIVGLGLLSVFGSPGTAGATGDAYFLVSPASGKYTIGSTIDFTVYESSSGTDNTNAVQVNLTYTSSLLKYKSITLTGPFTLCTQQSGGGGAVGIACASTSAQSGEKSIAKIAFSVTGKGTGHISLASGSDIDNTGGTSVWNGNYTGGEFSLVSTTSSSSSTSASPSKSSSTPSTTSKTTAPKTTTTKKPTVPTKPATTTTPTTTTTQTVTPATASYTVTVLSSNGQPINHAKVSLDSNISAYTNSEGKAMFSGMGVGTYDVTITSSGKKPYQTSITLSANQDKLASAKLATNPLMDEIIGAVILVILLIAAGLGFFIYRRRHPKFTAPGAGPIAPVSPPSSAPTPPLTTMFGTPTPTVPPTVRTSSYTPRVTTPTPPRPAQAQADPQWPPVIGKVG